MLKQKDNTYLLLWAMKYFNKWIFCLLPCYAKSWILRTLDLKIHKYSNIKCETVSQRILKGGKKALHKNSTWMHSMPLLYHL